MSQHDADLMVASSESSSRILQPSHLEKHSSKKDLIRRLRNVVHVLQTDDTIEPDSAEFPGLAATGTLLCQRYLNDRDKDVRLYSLLACMEILGIYAPDCPFDEDEVLSIFQQIITQVGNLAHTIDPQGKNYKQYYRILELLAHVKMGVVLVELGKTLSENDEELLSDNPMQLLAQLFHTLLHAVHKDHSHQVLELVQTSISACLDEYHTTVPIPLLDELLLCIGHGPTVWVINPAAHQPRLPHPTTGVAADGNGATKSKPHLKEPLQIEQTNPSYVVAAAILRASLNRLALPVAHLLNGLLNGEAHVASESSISCTSAAAGDNGGDANLYSIIFELHRAAPQVLTTVIGTLSNGLQNPDDDQRDAVVALLGRLFAAPKMAVQFRACYREWLGRHHDVQLSIRRGMVKHLCQIVSMPPGQAGDTVDEANQTLVAMLSDPSLEVRQDCIYQITDTVYRKAGTPNGMVVSSDLLQAVGSRVSAKHRDERRNALTGLAQIYYRHYMMVQLHDIQAGGDDCDISLVVSRLREACHLQTRHTRQHRTAGKRKRHKGFSLQHDDEDDDDAVHLNADEESYRWIPRKIFEAACFTDQVDTDMRSRVVQIVDEVLLGSDLSTRANKKLSPTARAVGFTMILDSLADDGDWFVYSSPAFKFLQQLFDQRASLHAALGRYLDARAAIRDHESGKFRTEAALLADANARECLDAVASLSAPPTGSTTALEDILSAIHGAKDKHIFRLLSSIVDPVQKPKTRARAFEDLPRRTKSLGEAASTWVKNLVRRCNMGDFMNGDVIAHCVLLARECFMEHDIPTCSLLVAAAKVGVDSFPELGAQPQTFQTLQELVCDCRKARTAEMKREIEESGILTLLSSILKNASKTKDIKESSASGSDDFQKQLLHLCTHDGSPEQSRNAVYTLARMLSSSSGGSDDNLPNVVRDKVQRFQPLLTSLTSRLTLQSPRLVSVLSSLAALADCAPDVLVSTKAGNKALKFALESVLLGQTNENKKDDQGALGYPESHDTPSPSKNRVSASSKKLKHLTPEASASLLEDTNLSQVCRAICAAIELMVALVRTCHLRKVSISVEGPGTDDLATRVFGVLTQILRDRGLPPSSRDRRVCKARQDRAALRQCAGVQLIRLCDQRLGFESTFLTPTFCRILGDSFLDEERIVRESMVKELSCLLSGKGVFGLEGSGLKPQPPPLRCLAWISLCSDGDHGIENDAANGNAANLGKLVHSISQAALGSVENLRKVCDSLCAQLRASGQDADTLFDTRYKTKFLPEYVMPFAFHLLVHRRETPYDDDSSAVPPKLDYNEDDIENDNNSAPLSVDDEGRHRILRKRLKLIFDPLVRSLGESADNISFLSRMTETLETQYQPKESARTDAFLSPIMASVGSDSSLDTKPTMEQGKRAAMLEKKLKAVCVAAREVLLSYVKKDVNLVSYPGKILVPPFLFTKKRIGSSVKLGKGSAQGKVPSIGSTLSLQQTKANPRITKRPFPDSISVTRPKSKSPKLSPAIRSASTARYSPKPPVQNAVEPEDMHELSSARKVHFSPAIGITLSAKEGPLTGDDGKEVSPIVKSNSPHSLRRSPRHRDSSDSATYGSSPPSELRVATMQSSAPDVLSIDSPQLRMEMSPEIRKNARGYPSSASESPIASFADNKGGADSQETLASHESRSTQDTSEAPSMSSDSASGPIDAGTRTSSKQVPKKKDSRPRGHLVHKANARTLTTPKQSKFASAAVAVAPASSMEDEDNLDFDDAGAAMENYPPRSNAHPSGNAPKKGSKAMSKKKSSTSQPAPRRSRRVAA